MNRFTHASIALLLLATLLIPPGCAEGEPDSADAHDDHDGLTDQAGRRASQFSEIKHTRL